MSRGEPRDLVPSRDALFVDFDGTLVEIAPSPASVRPAPYLADLLRALEGRLGGSLAVVTGRPVEDIDRFLAPMRLTVAGVHGRDRRLADGERRREVVDPAMLAEARDRFRALTLRFPGTLVEDKGESVALHYRNAPGAAGAVEQAGREIVSSRDDLRLVPGKMVVEVLPAGFDKGRAVGELLSRPPFAGRTPVYVGDDVTDEAGFAAANRLGGLSVRVGGESGAVAPTAAASVLADVRAVHAWLARAAGLPLEG